MKIRFEATPIASEQLTGIGIHEKELCTAMIKSAPENEYEFTYFSARDRKTKQKIMKTYESDNVRIRELSFMTSGFYRIIQCFLPIPYKWFFRGKPDVTHFFNFLLPPGVKGKAVVTVHDLAFVRYPETVLLKTRKLLSLRLKSTLKRADRIFVASEFTGEELNEVYGVPREKMTVVYAGVDRDLFRPREESECADVLRKYGVKYKSYFFYLGTIEPRKSLKRLVNAYAAACERLKSEGKDIPPRVLAGKLGWYYEEIEKAIKSTGNSAGIITPGYLSDKEKAVLYSGAKAFLFPSLYEGFGIPVLEAMSSGVAVLTSNISSLPEVAGDCAVLCNPESESEISDGIYKLSVDGRLCEELSEKGYRRSDNFSWEKSAEVMLGEYRKLTEGIK